MWKQVVVQLCLVYACHSLRSPTSTQRSQGGSVAQSQHIVDLSSEAASNPPNALANLLLAFNTFSPSFGQHRHFPVSKLLFAGSRPVAIGHSVPVMSEEDTLGDGADLILLDKSRLSRREFAAVAASIPVAAQAQVATAPLPYAKQPGFQLNTGTNFPSASFGLQIYGDGEAEKLTGVALQAGFRNFFASVLARNQKGFARAIKKSGIPREDLFICGSVLSNRAQGFDDAKALSARGCQDNMKAFAEGGIDYIDMIMLDYPGPDDDAIRGQWAALEDMKKAGLTRSLAVSNFSPKQLDVILAGKGTVPTVNQLPYGVGYNDYYRGNAAKVVEENRKRGVLVQAWSPLGRALDGEPRKQLDKIGKKYGKSAAQVALRWIVDSGATFTTQTKSTAHFNEDIDIFDFSLTPEEVQLLGSL